MCPGCVAARERRKGNAMSDTKLISPSALRVGDHFWIHDGPALVVIGLRQAERGTLVQAHFENLPKDEIVEYLLEYTEIYVASTEETAEKGA
ncbi:hypothetical protein LCGC14_1156410 [marine sediment metagenome]|uniref:Uncharacterized protein n=1 Tax=marine sediment metagenome TaxID=412755 RepID=A0A0F9LYU1_9ZZZZ